MQGILGEPDGSPRASKVISKHKLVDVGKVDATSDLDGLDGFIGGLLGRQLRLRRGLPFARAAGLPLPASLDDSHLHAKGALTAFGNSQDTPSFPPLNGTPDRGLRRCPKPGSFRAISPFQDL